MHDVLSILVVTTAASTLSECDDSDYMHHPDPLSSTNSNNYWAESHVGGKHGNDENGNEKELIGIVVSMDNPNS